jgi:hypothetical protein
VVPPRSGGAAASALRRSSHSTGKPTARTRWTACTARPHAGSGGTCGEPATRRSDRRNSQRPLATCMGWETAMRAAVLNAFGCALQVTEIPDPSPGNDDVLVRIKPVVSIRSTPRFAAVKPATRQRCCRPCSGLTGRDRGIGRTRGRTRPRPTLVPGSHLLGRLHSAAPADRTAARSPRRDLASRS